MVLTTAFEMLIVDSLLLRLAEERIRGLVFSVGHAWGSIGIMFFSLGGGILFDYYGCYAPFIVVGMLDLLFACTAIMCVCCGVLKNDIKERRLQREAQVRLLEDEII